MESYGKGAGDFGATPTLLVDRATSVMPITVTVSFQDKNQNAVPISGFDLEDIDLVGGVASNLQPSGLNYTFEVNATQKPQRLVLEIQAGKCRDDQNVSNSYGSTVIVYSDLVTKSEDLVGWLTFDELNGTQVNDQSGSGSTAYLVGNPLLHTDSPFTGSKSLLLDGMAMPQSIWSKEIYQYLSL